MAIAVNDFAHSVEQGRVEPLAILVDLGWKRHHNDPAAAFDV